MKSLLTRFVKDESGATAIEYGLIVAFISLVIAGVGGDIKTALSNVFSNIRDRLQEAAPAAGSGG